MVLLTHSVDHIVKGLNKMLSKLEALESYKQAQLDGIMSEATVVQNELTRTTRVKSKLQDLLR